MPATPDRTRKRVEALDERAKLVVGEVVAAAATDRLGGSSEQAAILSMDDTRMSYGG